MRRGKNKLLGRLLGKRGCGDEDLLEQLKLSDFFDTQVSALKMQLMEAFSKRSDYKEMKPLLEQLMS